MKKETKKQEVRDLRDQPVPPVTAGTDAVRSPDAVLSGKHPDQYDAVRFEQWQYPF